MSAGLVLSDLRKPFDEYTKRSFQLDALENDIKCNLKKVGDAFILIGFILHEINDKELWNTVHYSGGNYCRNIAQYAFVEFEFSSTMTHNLMTVAELFGNAERTGLKTEFQDFSFSQLIEMVSMPPVVWPQLAPYVTIKQMRALKKGEKVWPVTYQGMSRGNDFIQIPLELLQEKIPTSEFSETKSGASEMVVSERVPAACEELPTELQFTRREADIIIPAMKAAFTAFLTDVQHCVHVDVVHEYWDCLYKRFYAIASQYAVIEGLIASVPPVKPGCPCDNPDDPCDAEKKTFCFSKDAKGCADYKAWVSEVAV